MLVISVLDGQRLWYVLR